MTTTTTTIRVRGRDYSVESYERTNAHSGAVEHGYRLTGKRGATYFTMRNVKTPTLMFVVSHALASKVMEGVWLSDEGGELKVHRQ